MNVLGVLVFFAGLVALAKPGLLRLPNRWWAAGVAVLGMILVGVSAPPSLERTEEPTEDATTESVNTAKEESPCILVRRDPLPEDSEDLTVAGQIAAGFDLDGPVIIRNVYAVKSGAHANVYFVSAEVDAPGLDGDGDIGTWAKTGALHEPGLIAAVSGTREISILGTAGLSDRFSIADEGARESVECVRSVQ